MTFADTTVKSDIYMFTHLIVRSKSDSIFRTACKLQLLYEKVKSYDHLIRVVHSMTELYDYYHTNISYYLEKIDAWKEDPNKPFSEAKDFIFWGITKILEVCSLDFEMMHPDETTYAWFDCVIKMDEIIDKMLV